MRDATRSPLSGAFDRHRLLRAALSGALLFLAGCAAQPSRTGMAVNGGRVFDPKLGVWSSPRVVADGDAVPRGGGSYLTGRPYTIGGRTYVPSSNPSGYAAVGMASWYGDAFHGRRTANGEVFDKRSVSAAHPTLPLPSYVRVTNTKNGRSMVVRVNDRGPYHGGRVMDVSQRVAESLDFRGEGTARVRIEYLGRAALAGSDDSRLMASLRTDGSPAQLDGMTSASPVMTADATDAADESGPVSQSLPPQVERVAPLPVRAASVPMPPPRPFDLGEAEPGAPILHRRSRTSDHLADALSGPEPLAFAPADTPFGRAKAPFAALQDPRTSTLLSDRR